MNLIRMTERVRSASSGSVKCYNKILKCYFHYLLLVFVVHIVTHLLPSHIYTSRNSFNTSVCLMYHFILFLNYAATCILTHSNSFYTFYYVSCMYQQHLPLCYHVNYKYSRIYLHILLRRIKE